MHLVGWVVSLLWALNLCLLLFEVDLVKKINYNEP